MWITSLFNKLSLELNTTVKLTLFAKFMHHFSPNVTLHLHFVKFHDENKEAEKIIEMLGYYKIEKVVLDQSQFKLRASAMYVLQPP
jgi:hypothetical protein